MAGGRGQDLAYLKLDVDGGTPALLTNTKSDLSISIATGEIDTRDDASAGYNEAIIGDRTVTISGSFNYLPDEAGTVQLVLIDAAFDGTMLDLVWAYDTGTGYREYTGEGFVTDCSSTAADPETFSFTIRVTSKPTEGTQSA